MRSSVRRADPPHAAEFCFVPTDMGVSFLNLGSPQTGLVSALHLASEPHSYSRSHGWNPRFFQFSTMK